MEAVKALQAQVRDDDVERFFFNQVHAFRPCRRHFDLAALGLERIGDRNPHQRLIVNNQNTRLKHLGHASFPTGTRTCNAGSRTVNTVPFPTWLRTPISPPWRWTIPRLTDSPNPVPSPCPLV